MSRCNDKFWDALSCCEPKCCEPKCCGPKCGCGGKGKDCCKKPKKKESAQFVSNYTLIPRSYGQLIEGCWWQGNIQPVEFSSTVVTDGEKIELSGNNTVVLKPGRYQVATHVVVANFDNSDPQESDPIVMKLALNNIPLEYTTNSVDVANQEYALTSTQLNKTNIIDVTAPGSTLQWLAGNTVSKDFEFELFEASITIIEL